MPFPATLERIPKPAKRAAVLLVCLVVVGSGAGYVWAQGFNGRIAPNVSVGTVAIGGMEPEEARRAIQARIDQLLTDGITVDLDGQTASIPLSNLSGTDVTEYAAFDLNQAMAEAEAMGHHPNPALNVLTLALNAFVPKSVDIDVALQKDPVEAEIVQAFPGVEMPATDSTFSAHRVGSLWRVEATPSAPGRVFDFDAFFSEVEPGLRQLAEVQETLGMVDREPSVTEAVAEAETSNAAAALNGTPIEITYAPEKGSPQSWTIPAAALATMLIPTTQPEAPLGIAPEGLDTFLKPIAEQIEVPAENARFAIQGGRVTEFIGSKDGLSIDRETLRFALAAAVNTETSTITLAVIVSKPEITTEQVNDLGIEEQLGVGTSSFANSPANRIKNIRNGVRLLNGLLIAPGEEFSLLHALEPFDYENGYLPELVIKGDKIQPEIGGGLCQIGTTTFRATMNSGLPVLERQNHSLVVSYYNDPSNGNPGTDATIYDPAPDFKFKNDTGHYILFEAEMIDATQQLQFTFWGTSDGRKGFYSPPVVQRWIPAGAPVETETLDLAPGETKCQNVHIGADTSFTYTIQHPDGTSDDEVFESHYRPLPKMCLVGVEKLDAPPPAEPPGDAEPVIPPPPTEPTT